MDSSRWHIDFSSGWDLDTSSLLAFLIPGVVIPAVLFVLAFVQPTRRQTARWATVCGVTLTETNREQVRSHLARVRRFRSSAALPFWWLGSIRIIYAPFPEALATMFPAIATYLTGALVAEVTSDRVRTPVTAERRATLMARTMDDYAPRWIRLLPCILLVVGAASVALARFLEGPGRASGSAVVVVVATVLATGAVLAGHAIVRRPQRGSEADVLAADDALRATGVSTAHAVAALSGLMAASVGLATVTPESGTALLLSAPIWLATWGMAVGLLTLIVRQETWGYQRRHRQARAAAAAVPA